MVAPATAEAPQPRADGVGVYRPRRPRASSLYRLLERHFRELGLVVTTKVVKNGSAISGNIREILLVHHDGGYGPNPGHAATPSHGSLAPPHAERHLSAALLLHGKGDR